MLTTNKSHCHYSVFLAPMVGLTHVAFRALVRSYLPKEFKTFWPTEMLSSRRLPHEKLGETLQTLREDTENDLVPQILGNDRDLIEASIEKLIAWGAQGIDINMGCPVKKALKHNYGVALMGDASYAREVAQYAVEASSVPVSVKLRAGMQKDPQFLVNFVGGLQEVGVSWVTVHPRLASEKRRGLPDWSQVKLLKKEMEIPIIGNGDIQTAGDAISIFEKTQCDGVMIGRALTAKPWLMASLIKAMGYQGEFPRELPANGEEEAYLYGKNLLEFIEVCEKYFPAQEGLKRIRFFVKTGHVWLNFGHSLFARLQNISSYEQMKKEVEKFFFASGLKMSDHTQLKV